MVMMLSNLNEEYILALLCTNRISSFAHYWLSLETPAV
jgi:hypothetical protein